MENSVASYFVGVPGGLIMSLIAFSIVFIVILGLMWMMMGMKYVCRILEGGKEAPAAAANNTPPAPTATKAACVPMEDESELMAVISAAIFAVCGSAARVVAFSPVKAPAASSWRFMGRVQNTEGFQD